MYKNAAPIHPKGRLGPSAYTPHTLGISFHDAKFTSCLLNVRLVHSDPRKTILVQEEVSLAAQPTRLFPESNTTRAAYRFVSRAGQRLGALGWVGS